MKVCGVTLEDDLEFLAAAGVDTVGLNFVPSSPRCLSWTRGRQLSRRAGQLGLRSVAVVRDLPTAELCDLLSQVAVDFVQLHGQESPAVVSACRGLPIIKATSWTGREFEAELVAKWRPEAETGTLVAFLVDAYAPIAGGGTGKTARWDLLQPRPAALDEVPLILAGGLTPQNVAEAIRATQPEGVDAASGVELSPGVKSPQLVQAFVTNLPEGWKRLADN